MSEEDLWDDGGNTVLFRPSYSATWLNCGAALLDGRYYPDSAGIDAAVGTVFHDIMHEWLSTGKRPSYRLGQIAEVWKPEANRETDKPFLVEIDEDMFSFGQQCVEYIELFDGEMFVERRVDISSITPIPGQSGTLDVGFIGFRRLIIVDWKYGTGVKVFAPQNTQLLLYAWGVFQEFDWIYHFDEIEMHIAQPRLGHWDVWKITREELIEFAEWAKARARVAWQRKNRSYTPGIKQCTWCRRRVDCRARLASLEALVDEAFEIVDQEITEETAQAVQVVPPPKSMATTITRLSTKELGQILLYRRLFESWFKQIYETLLERGINGETMDEFYVTDGRTFRHWKSPEKIAEKLTFLGADDEELYEKPSLKSPKQMEKVLRSLGFKGKEITDYIELFVHRPPGKPALVRLTDGRPAMDDLSDVFEVEE